MTHRIDDWRGLYSEGWQGEITPDAFSHPAKFSRALIRAIYDHAAAEGWLAAGDMVVDPFGGVGLGGIDAMRLGCHWIGCELEQKFVDLGRANIELWESRYRAHFPAWGTARLLQGDSRQLAAHLAGARLAVSSPPYRGGGHHNGIFDTWGGEISEGDGGCADWAKRGIDYGRASGQMEQMGNDDTFWTAARIIVEQTYQVLKPGGHAVFVVKAFVRNKARVDFPGQWRQLCEAVGFVTLHEHRAWLVEERGTQIDLFGNHHTKTVEHKSFFRRLAESKGSPRIDWETVYCMVKPD